MATSQPSGEAESQRVLEQLRARLATITDSAAHRVDGCHDDGIADDRAHDRADDHADGTTAGSRSRPAAEAASPAAPEDDLSEADSEAVARTIVLRQLTAQAKTRTELARALRRKNVPQVAADTVLDRMEEVGLVDDAGFARAWVESRQQRRHLSATALRHELRTKGVAQEHVDTALADVGAEEELAAALALAQRKRASMRGLDRDTVRRRLSGVLGRRGFGTGVIVQVLGQVEQGDHDGA